MEGWTTTIALPSVPLTAFWAAFSAAGLIVVTTRLAVAAMIVVGSPDTTLPELSSIWTARPGLPCLVGARCSSRFAALASPGSL